jgi:phosphate transport system permease protein
MADERSEAERRPEQAGAAESYTSPRFAQKVRRRRRRETMLKAGGIVAIGIGVVLLTILIGTMVMRGHTAFVQTNVALDIHFDPERIEMTSGQGGEQPRIDSGNFRALIGDALRERLGVAAGRGEEASGEISEVDALVSGAATYRLRSILIDEPDLLGTTKRVWLPASDAVNQIVKGNAPRDVPQDQRLIDDRQLAWVDRLREAGDLEVRFNRDFFLNNASRQPEIAGIYGAVLGSALMLAVTLVLSVPIAVSAAVYLEEFAPKNRLTDWIEININNLAAVPSIVFGLLGLAVFINFFGLPRSTPIVGGLVLTLMTLPTIIIASRSALRAVPSSYREGALMVGASRLQAVFFHVLPNALPGILTGTIIGMAQALGETAPLLLVGMVAFVSAAPSGFFDPAAVLPVQVYLWSTSPQRGFVELTAAAILVLLVFLLAMNALAVFLRKRVEKRT